MATHLPIRKTISSVVLLRGVAALGVCLVHLQMFTGFHAGRLIDYIINNGQQGVPVFFVISGFILPYSLYQKKYELKNFFTFLLKRIVRVDPPYWVSILLIFWLTPLSLSLITTKSVFLHLTYAVPFFKNAYWYSDIFWTLSIEFQYYIILGLAFPFLMKMNGYASILLLIVISILCIRFTVRGIIIANVFQFVYGYIAFMAYTNKIALKKTLWILLLFTAYIVINKSIISGLVPASAACFILFYRNEIKVPGLYFLGIVSYALYLIHIPVSFFFLHYAVLFTSSQTLLFFASVLTSIGVAYLFYLIIEWPVLNLSQKIRM